MKKTKITGAKSVLAMTAMALSAPLLAAQADVTFYHRWGAAGELQALDAVTQELAARGRTLAPLPAGAGADQSIEAAIASGQPAVALKMHGQDLRSWSARPGALADVGSYPGAAQWKAALPEALLPFMVDGVQLHGVPVGMHRANSVWANQAVFERLGMAAPDSWEAFNAAAEKLKAAGIIPLALGGQDWQEATLFESVVLGMGGPDFYRAALVRNDPAALDSPTMRAVLRQMRLLSTMVDPAYDGRSWTDTAKLVMRGAAAMQIMGEWVKSEFLVAGLRPNQDFLCFPAPGTRGSFLFLSDFVGVFNAREPGARAASEALVQVVMDKDVQERFSLAKGSIPARLDVDGARLDACAQSALADRREAIARGTMLGSLTYQHATTDPVKDAIVAVVHAHFHGKLSEAEASRLLREKAGAAGAR